MTILDLLSVGVEIRFPSGVKLERRDDQIVVDAVYEIRCYRFDDHGLKVALKQAKEANEQIVRVNKKMQFREIAWTDRYALRGYAIHDGGSFEFDTIGDLESWLDTLENE